MRCCAGARSVGFGVQVGDEAVGFFQGGDPIEMVGEFRVDAHEYVEHDGRELVVDDDDDSAIRLDAAQEVANGDEAVGLGGKLGVLEVGEVGDGMGHGFAEGDSGFGSGAEIVPGPVAVVFIADDGVFRVFPGHMDAHGGLLLLLHRS
jgi:hypothetical protein